jgi:hypothetical protein
MQITRPVALIAAGSACALAGGAVGISQSAAAGHATAHRATRSTSHPRFPGAGGGPGDLGGMGGVGPFGAVHSVSEVLNKAGTAYIAETTDSGTITAVDSTSGTITLTEGTSKVTYGTPTITIPSSATVTLDGKTSSLADLAAKDHVTISSSSDGTTVFAIDSSFGPGGGRWHHPGGGPWNHPGGGQWNHAGGPPPSSTTTTTTSSSAG